jgi:hypothetical protein
MRKYDEELHQWIHYSLKNQRKEKLWSNNRGGEHCWGGNITIHRSACINKSTIKGDGD